MPPPVRFRMPVVTLMAPAVAGLAEALAGVAFADPEFPVVANATAAPVENAVDARRQLAEQLTAPVRWVESIAALAAMAADVRFVEIGPGTALGGLVKRIVTAPQCLSLGTADEVERFLG